MDGVGALMPAIQIAPPGFTGRSFRHTDYAGPWSYGNSLYGLFSNMANVDNPPVGDAPNMYKSIDGGATWNIMDPKVSADWVGSGAEPITASAGHGGFSIHRLGNLIYMAWISLTMSGPIVLGRIRLATFNLATDTWTIDVAPGGPELVGDKPGPPAPPEDSPAENDRYLMRVRADGTVVVWFMGSYNASGFGELAMWSWTSGGGWVDQGIVATDISQSHFPVGAVLDTVDPNVVHLFSGSTPRLLFSLPAVMELHHVTIRADFSLATYQTLSNDISRAEMNLAFGLADIGAGGSGIELAIPCLSDSTVAPLRSKLYVFHAPLAENPVWVTDQLAFPGGTRDYYLDYSPNPEGAFSCSVWFAANQLNVFVVTINAPPFVTDDSGTVWRASSIAGVWGPWTALYSSAAGSKIVLGDPNPMSVGTGIGLFFFGQDYQIAANTQYQYYLFLPGLQGTLEVQKVTVPASDPGLFDLQIDGSTEAANQGHGGTTGPVPVLAGLHQTGEIAGTGTSLADYVTTFGGDAAPDGSVTVGSSKSDVFIDTSDWPRALSPTSQFRGVYEFGGMLWGVVLKDLGVAPANTNLRVYSSADSGLTWIEQDSANRPLSVQAGASFYPGSGAIIHFVYKDNTTGALNYTTFDMNGPAWGAIVGGGPVTAPGGGVFMGQLASGDFAIFYRQVFGGLVHCVYSEFDGIVTWSAPVQVSGLGDDVPTDSQSVSTFLVDSSDVVHCIWRNLGFATDTIWHRAVTAGVPGAAQQIYVQGAGGTAHGGPANLVEWNGVLVFAYAKYMGPNPADKFPWVFYGIPAGSATPLWVDEEVSNTNNTPPSSPNECFQALAVKGGDLYAWWTTFNSGAGLMNSIYYNSTSGAGWGTDTFYFTDTPSNPFDDFFEQLSVTWLSSGVWGVFHDRIWPNYAGAGDHNSAAAFIVDAPDHKVVIITNTRVGPPPPPPPPYPFPVSPSGPCHKTVLHLWQAAKAPQVEITKDRYGDWTNCGTRLNKFFQGLVLDADTFGAPKTLQIRDADTLALHVLQPSPILHNGREGLAYSFATPFLAHLVRDETQDLVAWRKFGITYVWEPSPESVRTWITQRTAHGLKGYQHICRIEAAYESTANVILTLTAYDGTSPAPLVLPSTGGVYHKLLLTLTPNKGQLYEYSATSAAPFRLFLNDWTVWLGEWGRPGPYLAYRNLGGEFGDKASI